MKSAKKNPVSRTAAAEPAFWNKICSQGELRVTLAPHEVTARVASAVDAMSPESMFGRNVVCGHIGAGSFFFARKKFGMPNNGVVRLYGEIWPARDCSLIRYRVARPSILWWVLPALIAIALVLFLFLSFGVYELAVAGMSQSSVIHLIMGTVMILLGLLTAAITSALIVPMLLIPWSAMRNDPPRLVRFLHQLFEEERILEVHSAARG